MDLLQLVGQNDFNNIRKLCSTNRVDLEIVDSYGNTALLKACYLGRTESAIILMKFGASLKAINYFGQNALTLASYSSNLVIIENLLKLRSYEDFTKSSMIPPLCVAIIKGDQRLIHMYWRMYPRPETIQTVHGISAFELMKICKEQGHDPITRQRSSTVGYINRRFAAMPNCS